MSKVILCKYGESIEVDNFGLGAVALKCESVEPILDHQQAENLAATLVGMSGAHDGKRDFKCHSGDAQELSPRRAPGGHVSMILTDQRGAGYLGEFVLTPADALALAMELIRMATHE